MEILFETCLDDLLVLLIMDGKIIDKVHKKSIKKKSDMLPEAFTILMERNSVFPKDITKLYVTNGPGSFMGVRAGLTFATSLAIAMDVDLYFASSLHFISNGEKGEYYYDAKSDQCFYLKFPGEVKLVDQVCKAKLSYDSALNNIADSLKLFTKVNPTNLEANYIKEPRIN